MEDSKNQKRQVAYKVAVSDIQKGRYVKKDGWDPNQLVLEDGRSISRINIIGTIINKTTNIDLNYTNIVIDDGSGNISLRVFDNKDLIDFRVGDSILAIGRLREFGNERYVLPEIIKKIDPTWVELRQFELDKRPEEKNKIEVYNAEEDVLDSDNSITSLIKKLDNGEGADFNEIIEKSNNKDAEKILNNMIKCGELFEIKPGKIKVLE